MNDSCNLSHVIWTIYLMLFFINYINYFNFEISYTNHFLTFYFKKQLHGHLVLCFVFSAIKKQFSLHLMHERKQAQQSEGSLPR